MIEKIYSLEAGNGCADRLFTFLDALREYVTSTNLRLHVTAELRATLSSEKESVIKRALAAMPQNAGEQEGLKKELEQILIDDGVYTFATATFGEITTCAPKYDDSSPAWLARFSMPHGFAPKTNMNGTLLRRAEEYVPPVNATNGMRVGRVIARKVFAPESIVKLLKIIRRYHPDQYTLEFISFGFNPSRTFDAVKYDPLVQVNETGLVTVSSEKDSIPQELIAVVERAQCQLTSPKTA